MDGKVKSKVEFENGVVIEEGDSVKIVIADTGAIIEGLAVKVAKKNIEVEVADNFIGKVAYEEIEEVFKI